jgi:DNA-binding LacI/PurR family transcriptional regulator
MRDVARLADVSQSTVSRVLNQTPSQIPVSDETQQRIYQAVEQLGYHPNAHARSLRGQKTRMIAMLIADVSNAFYHPMVRAVQDVAREHEYDLIIASSDHRRENEEHFCQSIMRRPVDGLIIVPYHLSEDELEELLRRTGASIACLGQHIQHPQIDVVYGNDGEATYDAARWMIEVRGYREIGFIGVNPALLAGVRRYDAFRRAVDEAGLTVPAEFFQESDWSVEGGGRAMRALLDLPSPPRAVFACNDNMAIGAILAAQELGRIVPDDIAVIGFDNIAAGSWIRPRLTTVAQYPIEIGEQLARALFERIEKKYMGPGRRVEVPCRLIERESA